MQVYEKYIKGKNYVATSFVPKGQANFRGSTVAVSRRKIIEGKEDTFDASIAATYKKTPSTFDRSVELMYGQSKITSGMENKLSSGINMQTGPDH
jgi:zinc protease